MKEYITTILLGVFLLGSGALWGYTVATRIYQHNDTYISGFVDGLSVVITQKENEKTFFQTEEWSSDIPGKFDCKVIVNCPWADWRYTKASDVCEYEWFEKVQEKKELNDGEYCSEMSYKNANEW